MDRIYDIIKFETSKYNEMPKIFGKLQNSGHIASIYSLFEEIFSNEVNFVYSELKKIQDNRQKNLNIPQQAKLNTAIFKSNFETIVSLLINTLWIEINDREKTVCNKTSNNQSSVDVNTNNASKDNLSNLDLQSSCYELGQKSDEARERKISENSLVSETSFKARKNLGQSALGKSLSKNKSDSSFSSLKRYSIPNASKVKEDLNLSRTGKNRILDSSNLSQISLKNSKLENSEFSYISGSPATFSRSTRMQEIKESSPGPLKYEIERGEKVTRSKSPSVSFSHAQRISWFDEKAKEDQSPGPVYTPVRHYLSKRN